MVPTGLFNLRRLLLERSPMSHRAVARAVFCLLLLPRRNRLKAMSGPQYFDCVGTDMFRSESKIMHIMRHLHLPPVPAHLWKLG